VTGAPPTRLGVTGGNLPSRLALSHRHGGTYWLTPGAPPGRNLAPRRLMHQIGDPSQAP